jgi:RNA recognition motif-containing protein
LKQVNAEDLINQLKKPQSEIFKERVLFETKQRAEANGENPGEVSITRKERKELLSDGVEKQERTLFIGNLPIACATDRSLSKSLKARFSVYGAVESIRFRSIPFAEPQARRVAFIKRNFRKDGTGGTCNGYLVMEKREAAVGALSENATIFADRHLRVDLAADGEGSTKCNTKKSIFVGNLPMDLEEEPVWLLFGKCGSVTNVRLIRDRVTNMGKGIGYVTFASKDSVDLALKLAGTDLGGRPVRVSPCAKIGMSEKKKVRADALALKREKRTAALVKANPTPSSSNQLGSAKGPSSSNYDSPAPPAAPKISKKEAKLNAELQTKFGKLFHKKFPFSQAVSESKSKDVGNSKKVEKAKSGDLKIKNKKISNKNDIDVSSNKKIKTTSNKNIDVKTTSNKNKNDVSSKKIKTNSNKNNIAASSNNLAASSKPAVSKRIPVKISIPTAKKTQ